jgi:hypothetical protein
LLRNSSRVHIIVWQHKFVDGVTVNLNTSIIAQTGSMGVERHGRIDEARAHAEQSSGVKGAACIIAACNLQQISNKKLTVQQNIMRVEKRLKEATP